MEQVTIEDDEIAIIWSVEDVMKECKWLSKDEALDVLHDLKHNHDAIIGINKAIQKAGREKYVSKYIGEV